MDDATLLQITDRAYGMVFKGTVDFFALKAAVELGLFNAMAEGSHDLETLAQATESVPARLEKFLITLQQIGMVDQHDGQWALTPFAKQFFVASNQDNRNLSMVPFVDYTIDLVEQFYLRLADVVRGQLDFTSLVPHPPRTREDSLFYETLHRSNIYFPIKLLLERANLDGVQHLIDVGGGIGDIAIALCQKYPQLTVDLINLPSAQDLVRENVAEHGLSDRIKPVIVDMYREPYPKGDALLFSRILYPMNKQFSTMLCQKAYEALEPGGCVMILDMIISDSNKPNYDYLTHYICSIGMNFSVLEFKSHTIYPDVLRSVGFKDVQFDEAYDHVLYQAVK